MRARASGFRPEKSSTLCNCSTISDMARACPTLPPFGVELAFEVDGDHLRRGDCDAVPVLGGLVVLFQRAALRERTETITRVLDDRGVGRGSIGANRHGNRYAGVIDLFDVGFCGEAAVVPRSGKGQGLARL